MSKTPTERLRGTLFEAICKLREQRVNALCNRIESRLATLDALPTWVDDWVRRRFLPRAKLVPAEVLLACAVPAAPSEDDFLAACRRVGFTVKGRRVGAWPRRDEQARMRWHLHNLERHRRLHRAIAALLLTALEEVR